MSDQKDHRFDELLFLPHHTSKKRPHMSMEKRAAQFSPFSVLSGYEEAIRNSAHQQMEQLELEEAGIPVLEEDYEAE